VPQLHGTSRAEPGNRQIASSAFSALFQSFNASTHHTQLPAGNIICHATEVYLDIQTGLSAVGQPRPETQIQPHAE